MRDRLIWIFRLGVLWVLGASATYYATHPQLGGVTGDDWSTMVAGGFVFVAIGAAAAVIAALLRCRSARKGP